MRRLPSPSRFCFKAASLISATSWSETKYRTDSNSSMNPRHRRPAKPPTGMKAVGRRLAYPAIVAKSSSSLATSVVELKVSLAQRSTSIKERPNSNGTSATSSTRVAQRQPRTPLLKSPTPRAFLKNSRTATPSSMALTSSLLTMWLMQSPTATKNAAALPQAIKSMVGKPTWSTHSQTETGSAREPARPLMSSARSLTSISRPRSVAPTSPSAGFPTESWATSAWSTSATSSPTPSTSTTPATELPSTLFLPTTLGMATLPLCRAR